MANEKSSANMGSFDGGFETANSTETMYDEFPTKPMFSFDLEMSWT